MSDLLTQKDLKAIGVSASIVGIVVIVAAGFGAYKNYIELKKTRLEIKVLQKQLAEH